MNSAGDIAELAFALECYKRGWQLYFPYSHDTKIDMIVKGPKEQLISVQVKKGTLQKNPPHLAQTWKALVGSCKSSNKRDNGRPRFTKYKDEFDILAMYIAEHNKWIFHKLTDIKGKASVRWNSKHMDQADNWDILKTFNNKRQYD